MGQKGGGSTILPTPESMEIECLVCGAQPHQPCTQSYLRQSPLVKVHRKRVRDAIELAREVAQPEVRLDLAEEQIWVNQTLVATGADDCYALLRGVQQAYSALTRTEADA